MRSFLKWHRVLWAAVALALIYAGYRVIETGAAPGEFFSFMTAFLLETLLNLNRRQAILERIREDWGYMVQMGAVTCWEQFKGERMPNPLHAHRTEFVTRSHCHAWSAAPAYFLPITVLSAKPLAAGWERFELSPFLGDLRWAYGRLPLPEGALDFALERTESGVRGHVVIPEGYTAVIQGKEYGAGRHEVSL